MAEGKNVLLGIFAIILGLLVMAFPLISVFTASVLAGFTIMILGIWLFVQSFETWGTSKAMLEQEHIFQQTNNPDWTAECTAIQAETLEKYHDEYDIRVALMLSYVLKHCR